MTWYDRAMNMKYENNIRYSERFILFYYGSI